MTSDVSNSRERSAAQRIFHVVFFGARGAGKASLVRLLLGTDRPETPESTDSECPHGFFGTSDASFRVSWLSGFENDTPTLVASALAANCAVLVTNPGGTTREETYLHGLLLTSLDLGSVIVAVNKMDTVDFAKTRFEMGLASLRTLAEQYGGTITAAVPVSAAAGENVTETGSRTGWYSGQPLRAAIEAAAEAAGSGEATASGRASTPEEVADQFETRILWLSDRPMVSGRQYGIELEGESALATPEKPKYRLEPLTLKHLAAKTLKAGELGVANLALNKPVRFQTHMQGPGTGRFVLSERNTSEVVGIGLVRFALRRSTNVQRQSLSVKPASRAALNSHEPCVLWFTGLSGAGKSTIANIVERALNRQSCHTILLDGDNVRHGLNRDLGFTEADRAENIRRIAEVAKLMTDAGLITLVSFISPFASERRMARELIGSDKFFEVFVATPLEVAEERDVKGLYKKARRGEILNFTGIDSPYEQPEAPDLHLPAASATAEECAEKVIELLRIKKLIV